MNSEITIVIFMGDFMLHFQTLYRFAFILLENCLESFSFGDNSWFIILRITHYELNNYMNYMNLIT